MRILLVPGAGGSGPDHWDHRWQAMDARVRRFIPPDVNGGTRDDWVEALDRCIRASDEPAVLVAHSLGCIAVAYWAAGGHGPVKGALLVAPADVDWDWVPEGSLYARFAPVPLAPLPFASTLVASSNDPYLTHARAATLAEAWGAELVDVGPLGHIGSDAKLGDWAFGRALLDGLLARI